MSHSIEPVTPKNLEETLILLKTELGYIRDVAFCLSIAAREEAKYQLGKRQQAYVTDENIQSMRYWVARAEGSVLGASGVHLYTGEPEAWLGWTAISPNARKRGIGSKLVQHCMQQAQLAGARCINVETSVKEGREAAHRMYQRLGFRVIEEVQEDALHYLVRSYVFAEHLEEETVKEKTVPATTAASQG